MIEVALTETDIVIAIVPIEIDIATIGAVETTAPTATATIIVPIEIVATMIVTRMSVW
jgi:hypothetical protein